ncbi:peptidoglycan-binding domain-containing protein [Streptomyces sp. S.PNR 29]|uniref:peptidoglycan-binding domain-containing protein n=1 Tax=Streptomyces sp. S.PNR 29 TaxID=2973805 RepID=UPI0025B04CEC|nr:peptidoglycan-binding domain-containing protein [Streptomyces sp. S.PNR 29]MDN0194515.1 peptidoglycan-binding protein [Streptomyces sp. S.PNR 29]
MTERQGHQCPECGAPRGADNTPSCGCTLRASEALRDAREAEAAVAEDFDPLRIRPYVELDGGGEPPKTSPASPSRPSPEPDATMPLRAVGPQAPDAEATSVLPTPLAPPANDPSTTDLRLFETTEPGRATPGPDGTGTGTGEEPARRRRGALLSAAGAVVAVVAAAGYASGLFSYEAPSRDTALPEDIRAGVPDPSTSAPSAEPAAPSTPSARPTAAPPPPAAGASPSPSSPSPSATSASPTPSRSAEPTGTPTSPAPTASAEDPGNARQNAIPVLRRGDRGPEVTELQLRLSQVYLYSDEPDGEFGQRVEDALRNYQWSRGVDQKELGVYGKETRKRLESETEEP